MFQINIETQIKLYISNNFLVTMTTIVLMSDNILNIPIKRVFNILTLPFICNKYTSLIKIRIEAAVFCLQLVVPELELKLFSSNFCFRAGAGAFRLYYFYQSWSWSLKALGVKLEPAPNWSQLSISVANTTFYLTGTVHSTVGCTVHHTKNFFILYCVQYCI